MTLILFSRCRLSPLMTLNSLKPNAQRETELNSTQLNWTVQFSSVSRCTLNRRRFGDEIGGRRRFFTIGTHLWIDQSTQCLSLDENRRRAATTGDGRRRFVDGRRRFLTVKNLRRPSPVVAARRRFSAQRKTELNSTELNWTIQFSWVEFSWWWWWWWWVQFSAVDWPLISADVPLRNYSHVAALQTHHVSTKKPIWLLF